jgi:hypothetical protein
LFVVHNFVAVIEPSPAAVLGGNRSFSALEYYTKRTWDGNLTEDEYKQWQLADAVALKATTVTAIPKRLPNVIG